MAHWHYHSRTGSGSATPSLGAVSPACRHASHVSVYVSTEQRRLGDFASYASDIDHDRWHAMAAARSPACWFKLQSIVQSWGQLQRVRALSSRWPAAAAVPVNELRMVLSLVWRDGPIAGANSDIKSY